jgi:hypothetical protein
VSLSQASPHRVTKRVKREILRTLLVRADAQELALQPGTVVDGFRIGHSPEAGAYLAEFEVEQRTLTCPLYTFLPRTRILEPAAPLTPALQ